MLEVNNICKSFPKDPLSLFPSKKNKVTALEDVSFKLKEGDSLCILGKNGAGKSTLLKILVGLIDPDSGKVLVDGNYLRNGRSKAIGLVTSNERSFFWRLSILENLYFFAELNKIQSSEKKKKIDNFLDLFELSGKRDLKVMALSTGEKKKLSLIRTLLREPRIILFDEPTSSLDFQTSLDLITLIKDNYISRNKIIIWCTHLINEVSMVGNKFLILDAGKTIHNGLIKDYYDKNDLNNELIKYLGNS